MKVLATIALVFLYFIIGVVYITAFDYFVWGREKFNVEDCPVAMFWPLFLGALLIRFCAKGVSRFTCMICKQIKVLIEISKKKGE